MTDEYILSINLPISQSPNLPMKMAESDCPGPPISNLEIQLGTDTIHTNPDYSAAYVILSTNTGLEGHGLTFTIGPATRSARRP